MPEWTIGRGMMIPPIDRTSFPNAELRKALEDMAVGEYLFTTTIDRLRLNNAYMKVACAKRYSFVSRAMDGGIRVWRVA